MFWKNMHEGLKRKQLPVETGKDALSDMNSDFSFKVSIFQFSNHKIK